jgi:hypothetical protein
MNGENKMIDKNKKYTWMDRHVCIYEESKGIIYFKYKEKDGNWYDATCSEHSLKEVKEANEYEGIPIDTPGYAWNDEDNKLPRYFAGISPHGKTLVWMYGATSFSALGRKTWFDNFEPLSQVTPKKQVSQ